MGARLPYTLGISGSWIQGQSAGFESAADLMFQLGNAPAHYVAPDAYGTAPTWASLNVWKGDSRDEDTEWFGASGIAVDVDFEVVHVHVEECVAKNAKGQKCRAKEKNRDGMPQDIRLRAVEDAKTGKLVGNGFYDTPNGFRLLFLFDRFCDDRAIFCGAAMGILARVKDNLLALGYPVEKLPGLHLDSPVSSNFRGLVFLPNACVNGIWRQSCVGAMREERYAPDEIIPIDFIYKPETPTTNKGGAALDTLYGPSEFERAVQKWLDDHPREYPRELEACPACGHGVKTGCWHQRPRAPRRWVCFSSGHDVTQCGRPSQNEGVACWSGDALDLAAYSMGLSRRDLLRRDGYLVDDTEKMIKVWRDRLAEARKQGKRLLRAPGVEHGEDEPKTPPTDWNL